MLIVVARALRSAWRAVRWIGRGLAELFSGRPVDDELGMLLRDSKNSPIVGEIRRLAAAWRDSFCGACAAGPDYPQGRCPACLRKLAAILEPEGTSTPSSPGR